ncbi:predicted protein [Naegleria gruberi]|uniref:Predicted protein n=1 Tax=Naegleria gruberi TaxID=5762 RepID=D2VT46_NAEGR|nr:uncharacterized protein NAEGRDRAFT_72170 [Naegleria gruberi]EFC40020.1 predicted protein [Naegleria gruberi]|eukprot:XP_002672764.1 predicted protein [Naegleria gruberi strain NEG-M]
MGAKVKIQVKSCRNLPIMDRSSGLTDAYVVVKCGSEYQFKTPVCRKTLNPSWNIDAFRFEVPNNDYLQENVIEFKIIDYDVVTQDDVIGTVIVDTNLLALNQVNQFSGWLPIFDSFRGVCGELNIHIKIDFIQNINPYRDSCPEVQFFSCPSIYPLMEYTQYSIRISDFVEELLIDDDPEYDSFKDLLRSSRSSNDQRQLLLYQLSGRLKRRMGKKVQEANDNIIFGYEECFDLENDIIIVRGLGTRCKLSTKRLVEEIPQIALPGTPPMNIIPLTDFASSPLAAASVDSPTNTFNGQSDVKLITIKTLDSQHIKYMAGIVQARSVKLLSPDMKLSDMQKERDGWWNELRAEIKENARSLGCTHVIGYSEQYELFSKGSVCILCAEGTAAVLNPQFENYNIRNLSDDQEEKEVDKHIEDRYCRMFHLPKNSPFFRAGASVCPLRGDGYVPNMFISTCEIPNIIEQRFSLQQKHFIEARICRTKKKKFGESNAYSISNVLPFVVHDLHKQFVHKMNLCHCNAAFSVSYNLAINDNFIILTCRGTGLCIDALPRNEKMSFILPDEKDNTDQIRLLTDYSDYYSILLDNSIEERHEEAETEENVDSPRGKDLNDSISSGSENEELIESGSAGFALEMADEQDEDFINSLVEPLLPCGIHFTTLKHISELASKSMSHLQYIFLEKSFPLKTDNVKKQQQYIASLFRELYITLSFKLLLLSNEELNQSVYVMGISEKLRLEDSNDLIITLQAMPALVTSHQLKANPQLEQMKANLPQLLPPLPHPQSITTNIDIGSPRKRDTSPLNRGTSQNLTSSFETPEMLFNMDIDQKSETPSVIPEERDIDKEWMEEQYVVITPMYFIPGAKIEKVVGAITQHLVRESTNVVQFSSFQQECIMEATSIIRAHTKAIDCNALINYSVKFHAVLDNPSKKQAYIMLTISGDACKVSYSSSSGLQRLTELSK